MMISRAELELANGDMVIEQRAARAVRFTMPNYDARLTPALDNPKSWWLTTGIILNQIASNPSSRCERELQHEVDLKLPLLCSGALG